MPEWESDDEWSSIKSLVWGILVDAIQKSILADAPSSQCGTRSSPAALAEMAEARAWLMNETTTSPGTDLGGGRVSGVNCRSCLAALDISDMVLKQLLCHLWPREDKSIGSTIWKHLKTARVALKRETLYNRGISTSGKRGGGLKRCAAARGHKMLMKVSEVRRESMAWVEK